MDILTKQHFQMECEKYFENVLFLEFELLMKYNAIWNEDQVCYNVCICINIHGSFNLHYYIYLYS
jgi:hypothetical protein